MCTTSLFSHVVRAQLLRSLPVLPLVMGLTLMSAGAAQGQERIDPHDIAARFAYRVAIFSPTSGPPGTEVSVQWESLPAVTPMRLGVGALRLGFEVLKDILSDNRGGLSETIRIPDWAESSRPLMLVVFDFYFRPLAISSGFQVTEPDGTLSREGRVGENSARCTVLQGESGASYFLIGEMAELQPNDRVTVIGTLADPTVCGGGEDAVTIRVSQVRRGRGT